MAGRFRECQWWNALHDFPKEERKAGVRVTLPKETDSRVTAAHTVLPSSAWSEMEIRPCGSFLLRQSTVLDAENMVSSLMYFLVVMSF